MKFARDKGFDRLIKLEKDKLSRRIRVIIHRHRTSLTLPYEHVTANDQGLYKVPETRNTRLHLKKKNARSTAASGVRTVTAWMH